MTAFEGSEPGRPVRVRVPASSGNLGPGFDTLGLALALHNFFEGMPSDRFELQVSGPESRGLPPFTQENPLCRAIAAAYDARGRTAPPFRLAVECRVPLARGLGSSATAIVGGLMIASRFLEPELSRQELLDLATRIEGHPDNVAPALLGGMTAAAVGPGGLVRAAKMRLPASIEVVAVVPAYELSTAQARGVLPSSYSREDAVHNVSRVAVLVAQLCHGSIDGLWDLLDDRFHQPFRAPLVAGFERLLEAGREAGAAGGFLSGAGPTMLFLTQRDRAALLSKLVRAVDALGIDARVLPLGIEAAGARYTRPARSGPDT